MTKDLESKMANLRVSENEEPTGSKENQNVAEPIRQHGQTRTRPRNPLRIDKLVKVEDEFDTSQLEIKSPAYDEATKDQQTIMDFVKTYSDRGILSFRGYGRTIGEKYNVVKIGEGAYSSVFALDQKDRGESANSKANETTIIKLVPILLPSQSEAEGMTEPGHIASELQTMKIVDPIHGFIRYRGVLVVKGTWPRNFAQAFRNFKLRYKNRAFNEDPETAFDSNQHYALIEMGHAGMEINEIKRPSDFQIYDIFWATCLHLANAEVLVQFEHRDLHVSNVCIKPFDSNDDRIDVEESTVSTMIKKPDTILGMSNTSVTLIDYTFSRVSLPPGFDPEKTANFREFFIETEEYDVLAAQYCRAKLSTSGTQFEERMQSLAYAKVAKCVNVEHDKAEKEGRLAKPGTGELIDPWARHVPQTNVVWLAYLLTCLTQRAGKVAKTKYIAGSNELAMEIQDEIRGKLRALKGRLLEDDLDLMPRSAADVVRIGVENGWITKADLEAFKNRLEGQES